MRESVQPTMGARPAHAPASIDRLPEVVREYGSDEESLLARERYRTGMSGVRKSFKKKAEKLHRNRDFRGRRNA